MYTIALVLGLLAAVAALIPLANKIAIPYPILLVIGGIILGFIPNQILPWELGSFVINGLAFILIGLQLHPIVLALSGISLTHFPIAILSCSLSSASSS